MVSHLPLVLFPRPQATPGGAAESAAQLPVISWPGHIHLSGLWSLDSANQESSSNTLVCTLHVGQGVLGSSGPTNLSLVGYHSGDTTARTYQQSGSKTQTEIQSKTGMAVDCGKCRGPLRPHAPAASCTLVHFLSQR